MPRVSLLKSACYCYQVASNDETRLSASGIEPATKRARRGLSQTVGTCFGSLWGHKYLTFRMCNPDFENAARSTRTGRGIKSVPRARKKKTLLQHPSGADRSLAAKNGSPASSAASPPPPVKAAAWPVCLPVLSLWPPWSRGTSGSWYSWQSARCAVPARASTGR